MPRTDPRPNLALSALVFALLAPPGAAQVAAIGPFTGSHVETFETQADPGWVQCIVGGVFGGLAQLCTPSGTQCNLTSGWGFHCSIQEHGGTRFFGSAGGAAEFTFQTPVQRFGGWFGNNTSVGDGTVELYDPLGALISVEPLANPNDCQWHWNGWEATGPRLFARIVVKGNYSTGGFVMMDDLVVDEQVGPPPATFCFGDTACPCTPGMPDSGCENAHTTGGARLRTSGASVLSQESLTLHADRLPARASALFFQGTAELNGGTGIPFGDGKRCIGGTYVRLGTKPAPQGSASYGAGEVGDPLLSVRGQVPTGGAMRFYQVWYGNTQTYCTSATYNLSNAVRVTWVP